MVNSLNQLGSETFEISRSREDIEMEAEICNLAKLKDKDCSDSMLVELQNTSKRWKKNNYKRLRLELGIKDDIMEINDIRSRTRKGF